MPPQNQAPIPTNQVPPPMPVEHDGAPTVEKLKKTKLMLIGVSVLAGILLITTLVFASMASTTSAKLKAKYDKGVADGRSDQKQSDTIAFNKEITGSTRTYEAPASSGSFQLTYPKAWNIAVDSSSANPVEGRINPGFVDLTSPTQALSFTLVNNPYEETLKRYADKAKNGKGAIATQETTVSGIKGMQYTGKINEKNKKAVGTVVILPLRDKTMVLQTDDNKLYGDTYRQFLASAKLIP